MFTSILRYEDSEEYPRDVISKNIWSKATALFGFSCWGIEVQIMDQCGMWLML